MYKTNHERTEDLTALPVPLLAQKWHVNEATLRRWLRDGRLRGVKVCGSWLIPVAEIRRVLAGASDAS